MCSLSVWSRLKGGDLLSFSFCVDSLAASSFGECNVEVRSSPLWIYITGLARVWLRRGLGESSSSRSETPGQDDWLHFCLPGFLCSAGEDSIPTVSVVLLAVNHGRDVVGRLGVTASPCELARGLLTSTPSSLHYCEPPDIMRGKRVLWLVKQLGEDFVKLMKVILMNGRVAVWSFRCEESRDVWKWVDALATSLLLTEDDEICDEEKTIRSGEIAIIDAHYEHPHNSIIMDDLQEENRRPSSDNDNKRNNQSSASSSPIMYIRKEAGKLKTLVLPLFPLRWAESLFARQYSSSTEGLLIGLVPDDLSINPPLFPSCMGLHAVVLVNATVGGNSELEYEGTVKFLLLSEPPVDRRSLFDGFYCDCNNSKHISSSSHASSSLPLFLNHCILSVADKRWAAVLVKATAWLTVLHKVREYQKALFYCAIPLWHSDQLSVLNKVVTTVMTSEETAISSPREIVLQLPLRDFGVSFSLAWISTSPKFLHSDFVNDVPGESKSIFERHHTDGNHLEKCISKELSLPTRELVPDEKTFQQPSCGQHNNDTTTTTMASGIMKLGKDVFAATASKLLSLAASPSNRNSATSISSAGGAYAKESVIVIEQVPSRNPSPTKEYRFLQKDICFILSPGESAVVHLDIAALPFAKIDWKFDLLDQDVDFSVRAVVCAMDTFEQHEKQDDDETRNGIQESSPGNFEHRRYGRDIMFFELEKGLVESTGGFVTLVPCKSVVDGPGRLSGQFMHPLGPLVCLARDDASVRGLITFPAVDVCQQSSKERLLEKVKTDGFDSVALKSNLDRSSSVDGEEFPLASFRLMANDDDTLSSGRIDRSSCHRQQKKETNRCLIRYSFKWTNSHALFERRRVKFCLRGQVNNRREKRKPEWVLSTRRSGRESFHEPPYNCPPSLEEVFRKNALGWICKFENNNDPM